MTDAWHRVESFPLYWGLRALVCNLQVNEFVIHRMGNGQQIMDNAAPPSMVMLEISLP
jgi:hypothetical protein